MGLLCVRDRLTDCYGIDAYQLDSQIQNLCFQSSQTPINRFPCILVDYNYLIPSL